MRPRFWIFILLGVLGMLQYRLWLADGGIPSVHKLQALVTQEQAKVKRLRARNEAMKAEVADLKNGDGAIGGWARSELGMIKKGEDFFLLVKSPAGSNTSDHSAPQ